MKSDDVELIASAIRKIAHGDMEATGFEALCMAIAGSGTPGHDTLVSAIREIAESIRELADAVRATKE